MDEAGRTVAGLLLLWRVQGGDAAYSLAHTLVMGRAHHGHFTAFKRWCDGPALQMAPASAKHPFQGVELLCSQSHVAGMLGKNTGTFAGGCEGVCAGAVSRLVAMEGS